MHARRHLALIITSCTMLSTSLAVQTAAAQQMWIPPEGDFIEMNVPTPDYVFHLVNVGSLPATGLTITILSLDSNLGPPPNLLTVDLEPNWADSVDDNADGSLQPFENDNFVDPPGPQAKIILPPGQFIPFGFESTLRLQLDAPPHAACRAFVTFTLPSGPRHYDSTNTCRVGGGMDMITVGPGSGLTSTTVHNWEPHPIDTLFLQGTGGNPFAGLSLAPPFGNSRVIIGSLGDWACIRLNPPLGPLDSLDLFIETEHPVPDLASLFKVEVHTKEPCLADFNEDNTVNTGDFISFLNTYVQGCVGD